MTGSNFSGCAHSYLRSKEHTVQTLMYLVPFHTGIPYLSTLFPLPIHLNIVFLICCVISFLSYLQYLIHVSFLYFFNCVMTWMSEFLLSPSDIAKIIIFERHIHN